VTWPMGSVCDNVWARVRRARLWKAAALLRLPTPSACWCAAATASTAVWTRVDV